MPRAEMIDALFGRTKAGTARASQFSERPASQSSWPPESFCTAHCIQLKPLPAAQESRSRPCLLPPNVRRFLTVSLVPFLTQLRAITVTFSSFTGERLQFSLSPSSFLPGPPNIRCPRPLPRNQRASLQPTANSQNRSRPLRDFCVSPTSFTSIGAPLHSVPPTSAFCTDSCPDTLLAPFDSRETVALGLPRSFFNCT